MHPSALLAIHMSDDHTIFCEDRFQGVEIHTPEFIPEDRCYACDTPVTVDPDDPQSGINPDADAHFHLCSACALALGQLPNELI
jgi:hypothetical protein